MNRIIPNSFGRPAAFAGAARFQPMLAARGAANGFSGQFPFPDSGAYLASEAVDQSEPLSSAFLPPDVELQAEREKKLLGGSVAVKGLAGVAADFDWARKLCQPAPLTTTALCLNVKPRPNRAAGVPEWAVVKVDE